MSRKFERGTRGHQVSCWYFRIPVFYSWYVAIPGMGEGESSSADQCELIAAVEALIVKAIEAVSKSEDLSSRRPGLTEGDEATSAIEFIKYPNSRKLGLCWSCAGNLRESLSAPKVEIVQIAQLERGWIANGRIEKTWCFNCQDAYDALILYIPIACSAFPCPACGPGSKLTPIVQKIERLDVGYEFTAFLRCDKCSKERLVSKLLHGLAKIARLKIGPTGVEIEIKD